MLGQQKIQQRETPSKSQVESKGPSSIVFVHDGPLFRDSEGRYFEYAYHGLYERYSYIADNVSFLIRVADCGERTRYAQVPDGISIIPVPNFKSIGGLVSNRGKAERIIKQCVLDNDCFVLRLQSSIAQIAHKYIVKYEKPYIVESVGCPWDSYWNHSLLGKAVAPYMFFKTRRIIGRAPFVYYVTSDFLQRRYPSKSAKETVSCSNVVLDSTWPSFVLNRRLEKITSSDYSRELVLGTAATIDVRYKGQEYVIRALPRLIEAGFDVEYWLAGGTNRNSSDSYLADLARRVGVADKVVFVGALSSTEMEAFYDEIDIYVQPSKQEGLPRAVIEAMSRGCPVAGSSIAGIPELVQREYLFRAGDAADLGNAIVRLANSDLANVARRNFELSKRYSSNLLSARREFFYKRFLETYWPNTGNAARGAR